MFSIKGQIQPSHLSNLQQYRLISYFRDMDHPNTFYLPNLEQNSSNITFRIKGHRGTNSTFIFIKHVII